MACLASDSEMAIDCALALLYTAVHVVYISTQNNNITLSTVIFFS